MSIKAGRLRHRVQIQKKQYVGQDPNSGAELHDWVVLPGCESLPSEVLFMSAKEFYAADSKQSEMVGRITMRYSDLFSADMRILHKGKIYDPAGFLPDNSSGIEYVTVPIKNGVNQG